jgi:CheY-like chemotaxis protein
MTYLLEFRYPFSTEQDATLYNPDGLFAIEQLLLSKGYQVVTASSGNETLEKAQSERPHVILLDVITSWIEKHAR